MRLLRLAALVGALMLLAAVPAYAHVTVTGEGAVRGGSDATITFRAPTESDTLSTVELRVQLPTDTPLASVDTLAMPGWTDTEKTVTLKTPIHTDDGDITTAVSEIDWKATDGGIKPGSFGEFTVISGQLPDTDSLTFKALQTYSDGSVVSWIQVPAPGVDADSLEHPAPVLKLGAADSDTPDASGAAAPSSLTVTASPTADAPSPASSGSALSTTLGSVALVLAVVAVVLAAAALRSSRRTKL